MSRNRTSVISLTEHLTQVLAEQQAIASQGRANRATENRLYRLDELASDGIARLAACPAHTTREKEALLNFIPVYFQSGIPRLKEDGDLLIKAGYVLREIGN